MALARTFGALFARVDPLRAVLDLDWLTAAIARRMLKAMMNEGRA